MVLAVEYRKGCMMSRLMVAMRALYKVEAVLDSAGFGRGRSVGKPWQNRQQPPARLRSAYSCSWQCGSSLLQLSHVTWHTIIATLVLNIVPAAAQTMPVRGRAVKAYR